MREIEPVSESKREWYAVRTKPRRELFAAAQLERAGLEVYVPQLRVNRRHGKVAVHEPFFPGYLFAQLDPARSEIHLANYTPGVVQVVGYGGEPWPVPESLVTSIRERLTRGNAQQVNGYRRGDRVIVTHGPLAGIEAIFECNLTATGRVRVLIQMLQRLCPAEVRIGQLRRAS